jgi:NADPH2:quinone reductase
MSHAIRIHRPGGPEAMVWEPVEIGAPAPGEARLRHTAIGVNYIDIYYRTGLYKLDLPAVMGRSGLGVVEEVGPGVEDLAPGDRVVYAASPTGSYIEHRNMPANVLIRVPTAIDDETAAGMFLQGMTAQYLLRRTYRVRPEDTILVHAAAGGVGLIMCQWAKAIGATVIGTVGTEAKAEIARAHGCDHPIVYTSENFADRVREITGGKGVPVVYDSVGKDTFADSLDCIQPRGLMVSYGNASGPVPPMDLAVLAEKGSLFITRPRLYAYIAERADLEAGAAELFDVVERGVVAIRIARRFALADAAEAHRVLESRAVIGSMVLIP